MRIAAVLSVAALTAAPGSVRAFSGTYASGGGGDARNNTMRVVLMRGGTTTVVSMQPDYEGPLEDFVMVVPVPADVSLSRVRIVPRELLDRVDRLTAPRLVQEWEQDPCARPPSVSLIKAATDAGPARRRPGRSLQLAEIEGESDLAEYELELFSGSRVQEVSALLHRRGMRLPASVEPVLRRYARRGMQLLVARVHAGELEFRDGRALLSPLRLHYEESELTLRLLPGLSSSTGAQDVIVHVIAPRSRYEAANYPNAVVPTNLDVVASTREQLSAFYAALFDRTVLRSPRSVVTEYAWAATGCDTCPVRPLSSTELRFLGAEVLPASARRDLVLTRMHMRYRAEDLTEDLLLRAAAPIRGGSISRGPERADKNRFEARYTVRHPFAGPVRCAQPQAGLWGAPPSGRPAPPPVPAVDLAYAARGELRLASLLRTDIPELGVHGAAAALSRPAQEPPASIATARSAPDDCGCAADAPGSSWLALLVALFLLVRRR
jgi:MYXO-CTERM domain-containing protein